VRGRVTAHGFVLQAQRHVGLFDPALEGHFPGFPIFPGVLLLACLESVVAAVLGPREGAWPSLRKVRSVRFLAPLLPAEFFELEAQGQLQESGASYFTRATCWRRDRTRAATFQVELGYDAA
jgi:3-hydroxyacyl-[acyl-carrier-protein] dehydratase